KRLVTSRIWGFTPNTSGNTIMPRLGFWPAGSASQASIVVPSSTLISTCFEVMFDIAEKTIIGICYDCTIRFTESYRDRRGLPESDTGTADIAARAPRADRGRSLLCDSGVRQSDPIESRRKGNCRGGIYRVPTRSHRSKCGRRRRTLSCRGYGLDHRD